MRRRSAFALTALLALALPQAAFAKGAFDPAEEWELHEWIPIHIGPLDLSINKAVVYLLVGAAVTCILGIWIMRFSLSLRPNRRQTIGEALYDLIYGQIAESSLPSKGLALWFPYVAALFLFIWILNLIGFIPLPISDEHVHVAGVVEAPVQDRGDRERLGLLRPIIRLYLPRLGQRVGQEGDRVRHAGERRQRAHG